MLERFVNESYTHIAIAIIITFPPHYYWFIIAVLIDDLLHSQLDERIEYAAHPCIPVILRAFGKSQEDEGQALMWNAAILVAILLLIGATISTVCRRLKRGC